MKTLLTIIAVLVAIATSAQAERAVIYGTLTIINDYFVVKTAQPFETEIEDWTNHDKPIMVSTSKIQLAGYGPEIVPELRALIGKKVQMDGEIFPAHTRYHIEPLLLDISEGDFMERDFEAELKE